MKLIYTFIIICMLGLTVSCKKDEAKKSNEAKLISMTSTFGTVIIDTITDNVILKVPVSTDITKIILSFKITGNATIYPPSDVAADFTNPVTYTITSEDKTSKYVFKVSVMKPIVRFTVYDCSNWSPASSDIHQAGAVIKIYTTVSDVGTSKTYDMLTTDLNAQAILYGLRTNNYYLTVTKDNKSNIVNEYVLLGIYNNQAEVDSSPDPNATVGGFRYMDWNGDGRINQDDKSNYQVIWSQFDLDHNTVLLKDLYIAN